MGTSRVAPVVTWDSSASSGDRGPGAERGVGELQGPVSGRPVVPASPEVPPAEQIVVDRQQIPDARRGHSRVVEDHLKAVEFQVQGETPYSVES